MSKLCNRKNTSENALMEMGYSLSKSIGEGTYSKVCLAIKNDGSKKHAACKIIDKRHSGKEFLEKFLPRELGIARYLKHPNIVTMKNILETRNHIIIFMEYCPNGDLLEFIRENGPVEESESKQIFRQIVDAVLYLHDLDIAHRDLKCENVLLSHNNVIKICDFGFARFCVDGKGHKILSTTYCGSAAYAAPEIIQGINYNPKMYDIWALGCILYIIISATMPFDDSNVKRMLQSQLNRSLCPSSYKPWIGHSLALRTLIAYLLEPDVDSRLTIREVANSTWLNESLMRSSNNYSHNDADEIIVID